MGEHKNTWKSDHENEVNQEHPCSHREHPQSVLEHGQYWQTPIWGHTQLAKPFSFPYNYLVVTATLKGDQTNSADTLGNWGLKRSWVSPGAPRGTSDDLAYSWQCITSEDEQMRTRQHLNVTAWEPKKRGMVGVMLGINEVRVTCCCGKGQAYSLFLSLFFYVWYLPAYFCVWMQCRHMHLHLPAYG